MTVPDSPSAPTSYAAAPESRRRRLRVPRRAWLTVALVGLLPMTMGGEFSACLLAASALNSVIAARRVSSAETFTTCGTCTQTIGGRNYEDVGTAPEHPFVATFAIKPLGGALAIGDARCYVRLKRCGPLSVEQTFEVPLTESGLGLVGEFCLTGDTCIDPVTHQRQPAYWSVIIERSGAESIQADWEVSYVEYEPRAQPIGPTDKSCS